MESYGVMETTQQARPLLHTSSLIGHLENVEKLISGGANANEVDFSGTTPLQLASAAGHFAVAKLLISHGAKPEKQDPSHGNTCLHEASWRGYSSIVKILCTPNTINKQNNGGFTSLHLSCQAGHNQSTRELLIAGANPNLVNTYGDTPLHTAVRYGHAGVARILLSARCSGDTQNKNGDTALHVSVAMGRKKLTKILLSSACRADLKNHQRETPLHISLRKGYDEVTNVLKNPPKVLTPIQRDELRVSKYKGGPAKVPQQTLKVKVPDKSPPSRLQRKDEMKRESGSKKSSLRGSRSQPNLKTHKEPSEEESPNWSPYGCHYHPNPSAFPPPNIDSLPKEPLTSGELYYLDLAGNIHKGPMGVSEGCYCTPILSPRMIEPSSQCAKGCQDQLKTLTNQLSKIHIDTQAQLSSLHSMLNERLKDGGPSGFNENKLKDWVKQYRRFRKELAKNPKALFQANDLLESASALILTRPPSPPIEDSDSDSGI